MAQILRSVKLVYIHMNSARFPRGGQQSCNNFSIGIEIVNWGILKKKEGKFYCWPGNYSREYEGPDPVELEGEFWEPYTDEQYETLIPLTREIIQRQGISLSSIVGHSDIAPRRKVDPGPHFDWER